MSKIQGGRGEVPLGCFRDPGPDGGLRTFALPRTCVNSSLCAKSCAGISGARKPLPQPHPVPDQTTSSVGSDGAALVGLLTQVPMFWGHQLEVLSRRDSVTEVGTSLITGQWSLGKGRQGWQPGCAQGRGWGRPGGSSLGRRPELAGQRRGTCEAVCCTTCVLCSVWGRVGAECCATWSEAEPLSQRVQVHGCTPCGHVLKPEDCGGSAPLASDRNVTTGKAREYVENQVPQTDERALRGQSAARPHLHEAQAGGAPAAVLSSRQTAYLAASRFPQRFCSDVPKILGSHLRDRPGETLSCPSAHLPEQERELDESCSNA